MARRASWSPRPARPCCGSPRTSATRSAAIVVGDHRREREDHHEGHGRGGALARRFRTHASPGSFNNEIGVPITLLGAPPDTEVIVAELGARRKGDVTLLCEVAQPDDRRRHERRRRAHGDLRVLGGDRRGVRGAGRGARRRRASRVLNADDPVVAGLRGALAGARRDLRRDGRGGRASRGRARSTPTGAASFTLVAEGGRARVALPVPGEHMVPERARGGRGRA